MKTLKEQFRPNGGIAWVYRLVLPTGQKGRFYNVLSLSPYLELRERFPYLTYSCKSQLNSSNSENELQTRLLSIWAHGSCQDWDMLGDHPQHRFIASSPLSSPAMPSLAAITHLQAPVYSRTKVAYLTSQNMDTQKGIRQYNQYKKKLSMQFYFALFYYVLHNLNNWPFK